MVDARTAVAIYESIFGEEKLGQGRERVRSFLRENPKLLGEIEDRVRDKMAALT